jgi:DNA polymerase-3 subunit chi
MDDILLNLSEAVPTFFSRFEKTIEIVGVTEAERAPGRVRYKFYQDRGYQIQRFDHQS